MNTELAIFLTGSKVRLWGFTPSHDRLTFKIERENEVRFLVCVFCDIIKVPTFKIFTKPSFAQDGDFILLRDEGFEIRCVEIGLFDEDPT